MICGIVVGKHHRFVFTYIANVNKTRVREWTKWPPSLVTIILNFYIFSNFLILKVIMPSCSAPFCKHTRYKHPEGVTLLKLANI